MRSKVKIIGLGWSSGIKFDPSVTFAKMKFILHSHLGKFAYKKNNIIPTEIHIPEMQTTTRFKIFCFCNDGVVVATNAEAHNTVAITTTFDVYESLEIYFICFYTCLLLSNFNSNKYME